MYNTKITKRICTNFFNKLDERISNGFLFFSEEIAKLKMSLFLKQTKVDKLV